MASRAAVIVPLYKEAMTAAEAFSFRNTLTVLARHDIYVISPYRLSDHVDTFLASWPGRVQVVFFADAFFADINSYSALLSSSAFYRRFAAFEYLLIVQTDALVLDDSLDAWCGQGYSYVGAPWFKGFADPEQPLSFLGVGNGGFSLRKVSDFQRVLTFSGTLSRFPAAVIAGSRTPNRLIYYMRFAKHRLCTAFFLFPAVCSLINEDKFWGLLVPQCFPFFSVPSPEEAVAFSFEACPAYLFNLNRGRLPFGCHGWEKHDPEFWRNILAIMEIRNGR
jgi:hypothetical protein